MPIAQQYFSIANPAYSVGELAAWRAHSPLKIVNRVDTSFVAATPDYVYVEAQDLFGLAIDWITVVADATTPPATLRLELDPLTGPTQNLDLAILPDNQPVMVKFKDPLFINKGTKVTFQVLGLVDTNDYSIFASVFLWRPQDPSPASPGI